jgi:hypothetical protein
MDRTPILNHKLKSGFGQYHLHFLMLFFLNLAVILPLQAQWKTVDTERFCRAVDEEDWSLVNKKVRKLIKQWKYLDTSLGYHDYTGAIDSLVRIFQAMPCVEDAFADKCAMKIAIWPGTSIVGVNYLVNDSVQGFCYTLQEGKMRSIRLNGVFHFPLKSKEKLVFLSSHRCSGFIEEQRRNCEEQK